jgi:hypothetical protein
MSNNQNDIKNITTSTMNNNSNESNIESKSTSFYYEIPQIFSGQISSNNMQSHIQINNQQQNSSGENLSFYSIPQEISQSQFHLQSNNIYPITQSINQLNPNINTQNIPFQQQLIVPMENSSKIK